uniref:Uncharacterized protein n=1 Tax=Knipowitschia caucasica TaxID=637954 RepID=A0AAV2KSL5_KNICA
MSAPPPGVGGGGWGGGWGGGGGVGWGGEVGAWWVDELHMWTEVSRYITLKDHSDTPAAPSAHGSPPHSSSSQAST